MAGRSFWLKTIGRRPEHKSATASGQVGSAVLTCMLCVHLVPCRKIPSEISPAQAARQPGSQSPEDLNSTELTHHKSCLLRAAAGQDSPAAVIAKLWSAAGGAGLPDQSRALRPSRPPKPVSITPHALTRPSIFGPHTSESGVCLRRSERCCKLPRRAGKSGITLLSALRPAVGRGKRRHRGVGAR